MILVKPKPDGTSGTQVTDVLIKTKTSSFSVLVYMYMDIYRAKVANRTTKPNIPLDKWKQANESNMQT